MKTLFIFTTARGFGKGWDFSSALHEYERFNGKFRFSPKEYCRVYVFKAKELEDVSIDSLNWSTRNGAKFVASG